MHQWGSTGDEDSLHMEGRRKEIPKGAQADPQKELTPAGLSLCWPPGWPHPLTSLVFNTLLSSKHPSASITSCPTVTAGQTSVSSFSYFVGMQPRGSVIKRKDVDEMIRL